MKIVLGARAEDAQIDRLHAAYPGVTFVVAGSNEAILQEIVDADAYYGIPTREQLLAARNLRWIQTPIAGVDFLQRVPELVGRADVVLTNARGAHGATVAEHAFALLLSLTRRLRTFSAAQDHHAWTRRDDWGSLMGLAGLALGIVGYGTIGLAIGRRAAGFEMRVLAVDAQPIAPGDPAEAVWGLDRLPDLLRAVDVLMIAAPLTPQTRGMIGERELRLLKSGAYLVCISRGGIVDEPALVRALRDGHLAGAGLDVTETEPLPLESSLWDAPNLVITPHCANASPLTAELTWAIFVDNVGRFVRGEPLRNVVDKTLGY